MSPVVWVMIGLVVVIVLVKLKAAWRSPEALAAARAALGRGGRLVDVRSPGEFAAHHAPGAINVPVGDITAGRTKALGPKDEPLVLYCASGARSAVAAGALRRSGYVEIHDVGPFRNATQVTSAGG
jgi:rhodanese-related sulfurtransferase